MSKFKLFLLFLFIDILLLIFYLNIEENNLYYKYEYDNKPLVLINKELKIYKDDNLNNYFNIYSLNKYNKDLKIDKKNIIIDLKDYLNEYQYIFPFKYKEIKQNYIFAYYEDNKIYINKSNKLSKNNEIHIKKGTMLKDLIFNIMNSIDYSENEYLLNIEDLINENKEGKYEISIGKDKKIDIYFD